jgi:hypothetical protein
MSRTAAIRPVIKATRTVFPQTSAHRALYGLPKENDVGQHSAAPAFAAVRLWGGYPPPASASLRCKSGVEDIGVPSQVECSWGHNALYARGKGGDCSRGNGKG